jgi:hypothetical protein
MKFKIVQQGNEFVVKRKVLFFYVTEHQELGWNCSVPVQFKTIEKARQYIVEQMQKEVQVEYDIDGLTDAVLPLKEVL